MRVCVYCVLRMCYVCMLVCVNLHTCNRSKEWVFNCICVGGMLESQSANNPPVSIIQMKMKTHNNASHKYLTGCIIINLQLIKNNFSLLLSHAASSHGELLGHELK